MSKFKSNRKSVNTETSVTEIANTSESGFTDPHTKWKNKSVKSTTPMTRVSDGFKLDYVDNDLARLAKPFPIMKHVHASALNFSIPKLLLDPVIEDMRAAVLIYNSRTRLNIDQNVLKSYVVAAIDLIISANYLLFYQSITEQSYVQILIEQNLRSEIINRINSLLMHACIPRELVDMALKLTAPVQVNPHEIYTIGYHIIGIVDKVMNNMNKFIPFTQISSSLSNLYPSVTVNLTVHKDMRKLSLWNNKLTDMLLTDTADRNENVLVKYPRQFTDLAIIGYPLYWFDVFEHGALPSQGIKTTQQTSPPLLNTEWIDLGMEEVYWNKLIIEGNLDILAHKIARIHKPVNFNDKSGASAYPMSTVSDFRNKINNNNINTNNNER